MIKTILFDFDGTLINTNDVILASWQHTYEKYWGHRVDEAHIIQFFGEPLRDTVSREFPQEDPDEVMSYYREYQVSHAEQLVKIFDDIPELLRELKRKGYKLGIVTSRLRNSTEEYLKQFKIDRLFNDMVTCDDTHIHKPNPAPILLALEKLHNERDEVIMVGDSPFDMKCANNAEVESVLVGWRITSDNGQLVDDYEVDYEIDEPMQLIDLIESLNAFDDPNHASYEGTEFDE